MLPNIPKGFITNFPGTVPDFVGPRQFIFLLSLVAVLILTSFFVIFQNPLHERQNPQYFSFLNQLRQEAQLIQFPSSRLNNRYMENLDTASKEKDSQKQFEALSSNFDMLSGIYSSTHDPQIREKAQKLGDFIGGVFPDSQAKFTVPCLDGTCGKLAYSPEEGEILALATEATFKDPKTKEDFFRNMESAGAAQDQNTKWQYLDAAFRIVSAEGFGNEANKKLGEKLVELIKVVNPQVYAEFEGLGLYKIE